MKQVVDNFVKSSFKIFGTPIADEKKQAIINLTTAFYKKIQKKTKEVNTGPKIKYETSETVSNEASKCEKKKKTDKPTLPLGEFSHRPQGSAVLAESTLPLG